MSQLSINQFLGDLDRLRMVSGTNRETVVREAFKDLLKSWAKSHDLVFIPEYDFETPAKERRQVDGALLYSLRVPFGYWEAKDEDDDLDKEIDEKKRRGYPQDNIVFEDSRTAVLIQNRQEIIRSSVEDTRRLQRLLELFFSYERPEIAQFRKAVEQFKTDLPAVLGALREKIEEANKNNAAYRAAETKFLDHAKETINPAVTLADVREMLIQHILTEEIFSKVFDDGEFHRQNNIAKELYALEEKFFTGAAKKQTLKQLEPYYAAIRTAASQIPSHTEKQTFLKVIYENFYKVYNPKAADRLGVIYTPNEIVRFMIESADWLCEKHFGKSLIDRGVEILDPATGTGAFICELLEHFRGNKQKLAYKYEKELHANEVAILPYYVANLNIEATFAAITGRYAEFPNLCFVDTLDNVAGLGKFSGHQEELFGAMSEENVERIKRQNKRKISVIIGNPPYNANQQNENNNNKNREYPRIDKRIKDTYIKESTAQKTKLYDMYARFFRWASDRIKDEGIIAFVSNRSFIDSRTFDGFRKIIARDFNEIWVVDLGGDWKRKDFAGGGNVFGIGTGVAISFLVKRKEATRTPRIFYAPRPERETADDKLSFLSTMRLSDLDMIEVKPDVKQHWINQTDNDFDSFLPIASKETKSAKAKGQERAIFKLFSLGVVTNRDDWVWDTDRQSLTEKVSLFIGRYNQEVSKRTALSRDPQLVEPLDPSIKWTRLVKSDLRNGVRYKLERNKIISALWRPFSVRNLYYDKHLNEMQYQLDAIFGGERVPSILVSSGARGDACYMASNHLPCLDLFLPNACTVMSRTRIAPDGARLDNVTDWALEQFRARYEGGASPSPLAGEGGPASAGTDEGVAKGRAMEAKAGETKTEEWEDVSSPSSGRFAATFSHEGRREPAPSSGSPSANHLLPRGEKGTRLLEHARSMRKAPTEAEKILWHILRDRRFSGYKFRRQAPIGDYIADFVCFSQRLIVEADGSQHAESVRDAKRDAWFGAQGFRIRSFWNADILHRREEVAETLWHDLTAPSSGSPSANHLLPQGEKGVRPITKDAIFHYVYAMLHDPIYREKYALNLKREFPRIPFYEDFWCWADWGEALMTLHIGYEAVEPWPLRRIDTKDEKAQRAGVAPKTILKADKGNGVVVIVIDSETQLSGVPKQAWDYRLGNRSALEWILDQYKDKTPRDPTIREKFDTYRFADHKEKVVDLLARVTRVSVETQKIVEAMRALDREPSGSPEASAPEGARSEKAAFSN